MIKFRVRHKLVGAHQHCTIFVAPNEDTFANCGTIIMRDEELKALKKAFQATFHEEGKSKRGKP